MVNDILLKATIVNGARKKRQATFRALVYSGGVMHVDGPGAIIIDLKGLKLPSEVVLLSDHKNSNSAVLGQGRPFVKKNQLFLEGILADTDAAKEIISLAKSGINLEASVGIKVKKTQFLSENDTVVVNGISHTVDDEGVTLIIEAVLKEISIVPVAADGNTNLQIAARAAKFNGGIEKMTKEEILAAERERCAKVRALTANHITIQAQALENSWNETETELAVLRLERDDALLRATRAERPEVSGITISVGDNATHADVLASATLSHMGSPKLAEQEYGPEAAARGKALRCRTLIDLYAASFTLRNLPIPENQNELLRASGSLLDMSVAIGSAGHKIALEAYTQTPASWREVARTRPVSDFKDVSLLRMNIGKGFQTLAPGGELKHGDLGETVDTVKADTKGMILEIDRRDIINDDLSLFSDLAKNLGSAAIRSVSDSFWQTILNNKTSSGVDFYSSENANMLSGANSTLDDIDAIGDAVEAMIKQTDESGFAIDLRPSVLVVPPELLTFAKSLVRSQELAMHTSATVDGRPTSNPFSDLSVIVEPRISNSAYTGFSATAWYLFSNPANDAAATVVFLNGQEQPSIELLPQGPDTLGMIYRGWLDYGISLTEPRASVKNAGV